MCVREREREKEGERERKGEKETDGSFLDFANEPNLSLSLSLSLSLPRPFSSKHLSERPGLLEATEEYALSGMKRRITRVAGTSSPLPLSPSLSLSFSKSFFFLIFVEF